MRLITPCEPSVFLGPAEKATIPVHQLPQGGQINWTTGLVMTTILLNAPGQCADSLTNAVNAFEWATHNNSVTNTNLQHHQHYPQLHASTFKPVTPVRAHRLEQLLAGHPNPLAVSEVIKGFKHGFPLKYSGPLQNR